MIQHILVPVDGSPYAKRAVDLAAEMAAPLNARVSLVHVMTQAGSSRVPPELQEYARLEHIEITEHDLFENVAKRILDDARDQLSQKGVEPAAAALETGDPAHRIVDYAKAQDVDLIVLGSRGLSDLTGLLLGSVSHKVVHLADRPCLLVR